MSNRKVSLGEGGRCYKSLNKKADTVCVYINKYQDTNEIR